MSGPGRRQAPLRADRVNRRALLRRAVLGLSGPFLVGVVSACGGGRPPGGMMDDGMMGRGIPGPPTGGEMPPWMMSGGMDPQMRRDMPVIHQLLTDHEQIKRRVEDLLDGIRAETTSQEPQLAETIRTPVSQMKERVEQGNPIRQMDPLFREIFEHHRQIHMQVEEIPGGVRVVETSDDPRVVLLIRQHAHRAVSEFVAEGMPRAMQPTSLPAGYTG